MSVLSTLAARVSALVHPSAAADDLRRTSHEGFLFVHLAVSCLALLATPLFLAFFGAPQPWQTLVFLFLQAPLAASLLLSRTGRLRQAEMIVIVAILGLAGTLDLAIPGPHPAGLTLYILAPLVAAFTLDAALIVAAAVAAVAAFLIVSLLQPALVQTAASLTDAALIVLAAIAYVTALAVSSARSQKIRTHSERIGASRHETLSRTLGDLVLRHDRAGGVLSASEEARNLFALAPHDLIGRGLFERIHVADRPLFLKTIADALADDQTAIATLRLRTGRLGSSRNGFEEPIFAWIEFRARRSPDQSDGALLALARDITRAKHHEEQLEAARAEAERASLWKDRFLANVSHELRTPLNAIIGFAEMLSNDELIPASPEKRKEYAQIIETSGQHLLSVVNSILDVSKIEAGAFELAPEAFSLPALADSCCDMIRLKAERDGITILRSYSHALEDIVADKRSCKQILINLLSNAVKFTPKDGCVGVDIIPEGNSLKLVVADTGIGIAPRDLSQLGEPFFQASANYDRHFEGTGLGLSVVRGLVGLHGGTITVESAPGEGTTICVRLPLNCRSVTRRGEGSAKIETIVRRPRALPNMRGDNQAVAKIA
ncbi:MAG: PAS domain-containing sensor histidine kinase [Methylobacteriaceae bacterium]|nr:PAS domain-containing sensor histidine kinase [Methylobacteriaceae bacterium]